jgi:uncharacterized repeat protein (TIGR02543 family)
MSDIFVKTSGLGSTGWRKAASIFVKTAGLGSTGWRSAVGVWIRNATQWLKVWPLSGVFATRVPYIGTSSGTVYADRLTSSNVIRIGTSYVGNNALWDANGWTITGYSYQWNYYLGSDRSIYADPVATLRSGTGSGWTTSSGQDTLPTSIWNSTNSTNADETYIGFRVTATASNTTYNGVSESTRIKVVRRPPVNLTTSLSNYSTPTVGTSITYSSTWDTAEAYKANSSRTTIQWYRNSTNSTTGGTAATGTGNLTATYTPNADDVGKYLYVVETRYNSGTDYDYGLVTGVEATAITTATVANINYQATGNQRRVQLPAPFTQGTPVYVSTNGFVNWGGTDPAGAISLPDSGTTLAPLGGDLRQGQNTGNGTNTSTGGLWIYSDISNFYIRWEGNYYTDAAQLAEYQIKFYWNQSYADVYFINNSLTSITPNTIAVKNNANTYKTWEESTAQSSSLISTSVMTKLTEQDGVDDSRTLIGVTPGNITNVQNYNFATGISHLFLTTGTNTDTVKYKFAATVSGGYQTSEYTQTVASSTAYKFTDNLLSLFTLRTFPNDTYSPSTTYFSGNTVYYIGNFYSAKFVNNNIGFSGQVPTNTVYWTKIGTTSFQAGDYVLYNGIYYFAKPLASFDGFYPTNTTYWTSVYMPLQVTVTPYNGSVSGSPVTYSSSIFINPNGASDPLSISAGPTFSGVTASQITASYTTSVYTNRVVIDVTKGSPQTSISGYPYTKSVTGATQYTETPTGLSSGTTHYFYFTPRFLYDINYPTVFHDGSQATGNRDTLSLYTVTFNANGGTGSANPTSVTQTTAGGTVTLAAQGTLSRTNFTFGGWNTAADGSGTNYNASTSYTPASNITLYAKWNSSTYSVSYNAGTATSGTAPASQTKTAGVNLTLRTNTGSLARTGYTYAGWDTASDGSGTDYDSGGTYSTDANVTLYPRFTINTYTVSYDKNTTDTVGSMPTSQTKTYGVNLTLSSNTPTRTGYTFDGWATSSTGAVAYAAGATYSTNADLSLFAKWTAVSTSYTVTFKANGGSGADYTQTASTTTNLTANTFTRADTFVTPSFTGSLPGWTAGTNFQRTASTIRYGWNNGTQTWSGTINDYNFAGWNTAANGSGTSYSNGASYSFTANLTLYAQWTTSRRARGFNWQVRNANNTLSTSIVNSGFKSYTTVLDTRITVNSTNYPYLLYSGGTSPDITYSANARYGRIQLYQFGTDGNEYNSSWTGNI